MAKAEFTVVVSLTHDEWAALVELLGNMSVNDYRHFLDNDDERATTVGDVFDAIGSVGK